MAVLELAGFKRILPSLAPWVPSDLYAGGIKGLWYDPSDMSTLFQDSAGTLPYTALEQPVGLILDKSSGLELGPELWPQPDFASSSGLTVDASWVVSGGVASSSGGTGFLRAPDTISVGKWYKATITFTASAGSCSAPYDGFGSNRVSRAVSGTYTTYFLSSSTTALIYGSNFVGSISAASVRELKGNHASQVTSTARGVVSARVNMLQSTNSFSGGGWVGGAGIVVTPADTPSPLGGMADKIEMTAVGSDLRQLVQTVSTVLGTSYSGKFLVKAAAPEDIGKVIAFRHASGAAYLLTTLTADWAWVGRDEVSAVASTLFAITHRPALGTTSGVISFHLAAAEMKLANQAALPYQRVTTATDYDAVGFPKYLRLDGTDDSYTCGGGGSTTGFYYSDVIRPMGGAGTRRVIWSDRSGNNGYELAINTSDKLEFSAGNGTAITTVASTVSATVAEGKRYEVMDDGTNLSVQIDGSAPVTIARPVVTAGSSTITLYRGASTGYFNGQITEPIYRAGPPPSAYEREVIRTYQMQKAGML